MEWDFATNASVDEDTYAKVPETYRGAYEKGEDGKYGIAASAKPFVDTIVGLSGALKAERGVSKGLKGQKDAAEQIKEHLGFDTLEEAKAKLAELNAAVAAGAKVDPAKIKADIQATYDKQMLAKDEELGLMGKTLDKYLIKGAASTAIAVHKGNPVLLEPHISSRTKVVKDGDEYVVRVLDAQGDYRGDGRGGFMSVEDLVKELKGDKTFAGAFESDLPGGADERPGRRPSDTQRRSTTQQQTRENMSPTDLLAAGLAARRNRR